MVPEVYTIKLLSLMCVVSKIDIDGCNFSFSATVYWRTFAARRAVMLRKHCRYWKLLLHNCIVICNTLHGRIKGKIQSDVPGLLTTSCTLGK